MVNAATSSQFYFCSSTNKMADLPLDEMMRRRFFRNNIRGINNRSLVGRGAGDFGGTFDARLKIGNTDVKQRLGGSGTVFQVKDAREKLSQKDPRFQVRGSSAGKTIQDARQTINSRKEQHGLKRLHSTRTDDPPEVNQQVHHNRSNVNKAFLNVSPSPLGLNVKVGVALQQGGGPKREVDARDRLRLKRSPALLSSFKITKTIQKPAVGLTSGICVGVARRNNQMDEMEPGSDAEESVVGEEDVTPGKQMKVVTSGSALHEQADSIGCPFSLSSPITKVVQNDSYTASPSVQIPPSASPPAPALQPVSRTLITGQIQQGIREDAEPLIGTQPAFSPLEGTKMTVNNLHPRVTEEDIVELFCVCGALKRTRLLQTGVAEVVFVRKEDAIAAYRKYNNRCLDGQPMKCNLHIQGNVITSDQPILLRLSDTPGVSDAKTEGLPTSLSHPVGRSASSQPPVEVNPQTILKALFKSSLPPSTSSDSAGSQATAFCIKI
ncbi:polymerase delta-interacting protein 3 isoform X2 [Brienomyrus brachyistius]|uniref:polymerase delta-interacting protein 3 isoform X2 n=1 Tax=Brienomyrus brachyistius TaxID=42636 RepID=UPI0020B43458|nr:polymerase delta-interacting protein 3 isoform X2 [Brienomyrus brachyistius]